MVRISVLFAFLVTHLFNGNLASAQLKAIFSKKPVPDITDSLNSGYQRLLKQYGPNIKTPPGLEKQILYALSYFPDLEKTKIRFKLNKSTGGIIATRPTVGSLLRRSSKRTYIVFISDSIKGRTMPMFANSDVNGQVGILGHELCHIVYFNNSTGFGLLGLAISHVSKKYMDRFEYNTDSMDIVRGLGYQLIAWNIYLHKKFSQMRTQSGTTPAPPAGLNKRYMSVEQIRRQMAARSKL